jgi:hypothetical protein
MKRLQLAVCCLFTFALGSTVAEASSSQAWLEFQQSIRKACMVEALKAFDNPEATVDSYGSPSYGIAYVEGRPKKSLRSDNPTDANSLFSAICIYNKYTKRAELSGFIERSFRSP